MSESFMNYHHDPYIREYTDRGMAKWLGFYLSEHTTEMEKERNRRQSMPIRREAMSYLEISKVLFDAYTKKKIVEIQMASLDSNNRPSESIIGTIEGINGTSVFILSRENKEIQLIDLELIHSLLFMDERKWSDLKWD